MSLEPGSPTRRPVAASGVRHRGRSLPWLLRLVYAALLCTAIARIDAAVSTSDGDALTPLQSPPEGWLLWTVEIGRDGGRPAPDRR